MADYLPENLAAVRRWQTRAPEAYSWRQYARSGRRVAVAGGYRRGGRPARGRRAGTHRALARAVILKRPAILGSRDTYPVVGAFYCTEEVGISIPRWECVMEHLGRTVTPGGMLFLSCLQDTDFYMVGEMRYPCARITEDDVRRALSSLGFESRPRRSRASRWNHSVKLGSSASSWPLRGSALSGYLRVHFSPASRRSRSVRTGPCWRR